MRDSLDQFWADARAVKLTPEERADLRDAIVGMHTVRASSSAVSLTPEEKRSGKQALQDFIVLHPGTRSRFSFGHVLSVFSLRSLSSAVAVIVLLSGIGGGVASAAEDTVPGDLLYPVKVDITEPIRERFHWNPEKRARFAARRVERRMHEAEQLIKRHRRPPQSLEELQTRMEHHLARMEERLEFLESEEDAERIRAHLEKKMAAHEQMLTKILNGEVNKEEFRTFKKQMRQKRERVKGMRPASRRSRPKSFEKAKDPYKAIPLRRDSSQKFKNAS